MLHCLNTQIFHSITDWLDKKSTLETTEISSIFIILTSESLFLNAACCWLFNGYSLLPTLVPKPEWYFIDISIDIYCSNSTQNKDQNSGFICIASLYPKTLFKDKKIVFIKLDSPTPAPPVINIWNDVWCNFFNHFTT